MGWARDITMMEECGSRVWAFWMEEDVFGRLAREHRPGKRELNGRFQAHPLAQMMRERIEHPEWTWRKERRDSHRLETAEEIAVRAAA